MGMMMSGLSWMFMLLVMLGQGSGELLDMVGSDSYWRSKGITEVTAAQLIKDADPTAASTTTKAKVLSEEEEERATSRPAGSIVRAAEVRQLMAIRTLGERKEKSAVAVLTKLQGSKKIFVAEYATRALAQIAGKPYVRPARTGDAAADLQLLPRDTGIVAGVNGAGQERSAGEFFKTMIEQQVGAGAKLDERTRQQYLDMASMQIIQGAEMLGNFRIDAAQLGLSKDIGNDSGWAMVLIRGKYEPAALVAASPALIFQGGKITKEGTVTLVELRPNAHLLLFSEEQLAFVFGPEKTDFAPIIKALLAAHKAGKGTLAENKELGALLTKVDTKALLWAAGTLNPEMRSAKPLEAFQTFAATVAQEKDGLKLRLEATGTEAAEVQAAVKTVNDGVQGAIKQMDEFKQQQPAAAKMIQPALAIMQSVKCEATVKTATLRASAPSFDALLNSTSVLMMGARGAAGRPTTSTMHAPAESQSALPE